jgi:hypothetical protein
LYIKNKNVWFLNQLQRKFLEMKKRFVLGIVFLLVFGSLGVYAQSTKLIGTWVSIVGKEFSADPTILKITDDKISILSGDRGGVSTKSWSWSDNNDGMTLTIDNRFALYMVTDTILLIGLPKYDDLVDYYYLTKYVEVPFSKLIGKWVMPEESSDLEITFSNTQIIMKRGRQTKTWACRFDDESSNSIKIHFSGEGGGDWYSYLFFFIDESHLYVTLPELSSSSHVNPMGHGHFLTKQ